MSAPMTDGGAATHPFDDPHWQADLIRFATRQSGLAPERVARVVEICAAEVPVGRALIADLVRPGLRVLEVGAGIGLLAHGLRRCGLDVTALEPGANGFGDSARIGAAVRAFIGEDLPILDKEASGLHPGTDGSFDLIFSVNVIEHIPDLEANFAAMLAVLAPDGIMAHTCPNYHVPYEPHYAIPLVPGFPRATAMLKPGLRDDALWRSLNFVTTTRVAWFARREGLDIEFARGTLYDAIRRIDDDPQFRLRHPGPVPVVYDLLKRIGLVQALRHLPPALATPMRFTLRRPQRRAP